jgi:hypothetical protein
VSGFIGGTDVSKVDVSQMDPNATLAANSDNMLATQKAAKTYIDSVRRRTYVNGQLRSQILDWTDSVTTNSSGQAIFYITDTRTAGGNAVASALFADTIQINYVDGSGVYATGTPVISGDLKSVTVPVFKQAFAGVTVVGVNVLGSASQSTAPAGVTVKMQVIGTTA